MEGAARYVCLRSASKMLCLCPKTCFRDPYPCAPEQSGAPLHPPGGSGALGAAPTGFVHPQLLAEGRTLLIYFIYSLWGWFFPLSKTQEYR